MQIDTIIKNLELFIDTYNSKVLLENINISRISLSLDDNAVNLNIQYHESDYSDILRFESTGQIFKVEVWNDPEVLINVTYSDPVEVDKLNENEFGWTKVYNLIKACARSRANNA